MLDSLDGGHVSSRQSDVAYIYIYIYIYICVCVFKPVKVKKRIPLIRSTFYDVENSTPLVGLEPTISRLRIELH